VNLSNPVLTAINDNCLPGNKGSIIAGQKQNRTLNVRRFPHMLDGLLFPSGAFLLI
jgi:hypothetical protein